MKNISEKMYSALLLSYNNNSFLSHFTLFGLWKPKPCCLQRKTKAKWINELIISFFKKQLFDFQKKSVSQKTTLKEGGHKISKPNEQTEHETKK